MKFILKKMKKKKIAQLILFVLFLIKNSKKKMVSVTGKIYGTIASKISGKKGFGYDPIFIPNFYIKLLEKCQKVKN